MSQNKSFVVGFTARNLRYANAWVQRLSKKTGIPLDWVCRKSAVSVYGGGGLDQIRQAICHDPNRPDVVWFMENNA